MLEQEEGQVNLPILGRPLPLGALAGVLESLGSHRMLALKETPSNITQL